MCITKLMVLMLCFPYFTNNSNVLKPQNSFKLDFFKHMITLSCSFCDDLFNNMSHTSIKCHLIFIFELLLIKNQIVNLTFGQKICHDSKLSTPNGKCPNLSNIGPKLDHIYYLHFCPKNFQHFKTLTPKVIFTPKCLGLASLTLSHIYKSVFESCGIFLVAPLEMNL